MLLPKSNKKQVIRNKIWKNIAIFSILVNSQCSGININANAGLYGIDSANPLTKSEKNLTTVFAPNSIVNYPQEMRDNVIMLSDYAKSNNPDFQVVVHEGQTLVTESAFERGLRGYELAKNKKEDKTFLSKKILSPKFNDEYLRKIDGVIKNDVFFKNGQTKVIKSDNSDMIKKFGDVKNYWFDLSDEVYHNKQEKIMAIKNSSFDLIVINPMFKNREKYTPDEIRAMQFKQNGAERLVFAEVNVSEIKPDDYRFEEEWKIGKPAWLARASFVDSDGIVVKYWSEPWKKILSRHLKSVVAYGYNGAFLTGLDNHKYFQSLTPVE